MTREHIPELAKQLGMRPQFILKLASGLAEQVPAAMDQAVDEVTPSLSPDAKALVDRLNKFVLSTTRKTAARLAR